MTSPASYPAVAPDVRLVDLFERGRPRLTSGYYIAAPQPAIVETGAARSVPRWTGALTGFGVAPADVAYVIVTHIHLDHAGGAGVLLEHLPNARVVVHPRGARHLIDPRRLIEGARGVFGENLEKYFGLPEPVPESRLLVVDDGGRLDLGGGHVLRFFDARGHARHQHMILDEGTASLFAADELGGRLPDIAEDYVLPDAAPPQFDPDEQIRSADRLLELRPEHVLFSHFGRYPLGVEALHARLTEQVRAFTALGWTAGGVGDRPAGPEEVARRLQAHVRRDLARRGLAWTAEVEAVLGERLAASAQGIADYCARQARQSAQ